MEWSREINALSAPHTVASAHPGVLLMAMRMEADNR